MLKILHKLQKERPHCQWQGSVALLVFLISFYFQTFNESIKYGKGVKSKFEITKTKVVFYG